MAIKEIRLKDFRNIQEMALELSSGTTIFYGGIGEGKTNLIEAIYLLSIGRSYRTSNSRNMIFWGKDEAAIRGEGENNAGNLSMQVRIQGSGKKVEVNGTSYSKSLELLGRFRSVLFHQEDLKIVTGEPAFRRRFLDVVISQISKNYAYSLGDYYRVLRQRNHALLNTGEKDTEIWDEQLSGLGAWITEVREKVSKELETISARLFKVLRGEEVQLSIGYIKSGTSNKEEYLEQLKQTKALDLSRGTTNVGPHRDDIEIKISGKDVKNFASSGEQKVVMLSLKMAEVELIKGVTEEAPVLLLDDVFSSIDEQRSRSLIQSTGAGMQCIITTTDLNNVQRDLLGEAKLYEVKKGKAIKH